MRIDVFTLFPEAFDWFRGQRHVTNALAQGHELETVDPRATTPLKWGQVDDTPFGGGAGMVLRVDVMEAALRARYGVDPLELPRRRRVIALTPAGLLDPSIAIAASRAEGVGILDLEYERDATRALTSLATLAVGPLRVLPECRQELAVGSGAVREDLGADLEPVQLSPRARDVAEPNAPVEKE